MTATKKAPQLDNQTGSGKGFMLIIVGILVIGLAAIAYFVTTRESTLSTAATAPVELEGDTLPAFPNTSGGVTVDPAEDEAIGMDFPSMSGTDFSDEPVSISDDGRAKVVFFLAHWCPNCQRELPLVVELTENGQIPDGVDVYGINTSYDPSRGNPPGRWFSIEGWQHPVIRDTEDSELLRSAGAGGFPYAVYVDADNKVVARTSGEVGSQAIISLMELAASGAPE